jgi:hypothetical protein
MRLTHPTRVEASETIHRARLRLKKRSLVRAMVASIKRIGSAVERARPTVSASEAGIQRHLQLAALVEKGHGNSSQNIHRHYEAVPGLARGDTGAGQYRRSSASLIDSLTGPARTLKAISERLSPAVKQSIALDRRAGGSTRLESNQVIGPNRRRKAVADLTSGKRVNTGRTWTRQSPENIAKTRSNLRGERFSPRIIEGFGRTRPSGGSPLYGGPNTSSWRLLMNTLASARQRQSAESFSGRRAMMKIEGASQEGYDLRAPKHLSMSRESATTRNGRARPSLAAASGHFAWSAVQRHLSNLYRNQTARAGGSRPDATASRLIQQLRSQQPALSHSKPTDSAVARPTRAKFDASEAPAPLVVNFSPTIVIQGKIEAENIEGTVIRAIRTHSHELIHIINRELQTQRRAAF